MDQFSEKKHEVFFDIEKSQVKEAYILLDAKNPLELSRRYTEEDQKIARTGSWDYTDQNLITNQVKTILESIDLETIPEEEREWIQEILWFWYHHAISHAIIIKDKVAAQMFAKKALEYQGPDHPNQITQLLSFLVNDQVVEAERWVKTIPNEPEKSTAQHLLEIFKEQGFF